MIANRLLLLTPSWGLESSDANQIRHTKCKFTRLLIFKEIYYFKNIFS